MFKMFMTARAALADWQPLATSVATAQKTFEEMGYIRWATNQDGSFLMRKGEHWVAIQAGA